MSAHVDHNEQYWDGYAEPYLLGHEEQLRTDVPTWSLFGLPESELQALGRYADRDVVELGCGAAQLSIALARGGARCTGVDISTVQLELAREQLAAAEAADGVRPDVRLVQGDVEALELADASFDLAVSDYGASMFADPLRWVPEAARVLRPGGRLAFSMITPILECCWPPDQRRAGPELVKDYFGMHRIEDRAVYFNLPYGEWVRLFRRSGLEILDLIETQPPAHVRETPYRSENQIRWSRRWPAEMIWVVARR